MYALHERIGTASTLNPAFRQTNKVQIGLPVLSAYQFGLGNSGFTLDQVTHFNGDTMFFDVDRLPDVLRDRNFMNIDQSIGLLSVCINRPTYSAELFANLTTNFVFEYPGDLFRLAIEGNAAHLGETLAFGSIGFDLNNYAEAGVRYARQLGKLTVGVAPKLVVGLQNISTVHNDISLHTAETTFDLEGNMDVLVQTAGFFDSTFATGLGENALREMAAFRNLGWGVDLGATYRYSDALTFSMSMTDIGRVRWKSMVRSFTSQGQYQFSGVDLFELVEQSDTLNGFDAYIDSLGSMFELKEFSQPYSTWLPARFYAGASYRVLKNTHAGVTFSSQWNTRRMSPSFGIGVTQYVGRKLAASVTYSYFNRDWFNVGVGLLAGAGPFELFVTSDNILGLVNYRKVRNAHVHAGIQLAFGRLKRDALRGE